MGQVWHCGRKKEGKGERVGDGEKEEGRRKGGREEGKEERGDILNQSIVLTYSQYIEIFLSLGPLLVAIYILIAFSRETEPVG